MRGRARKERQPAHETGAASATEKERRHNRKRGRELERNTESSVLMSSIGEGKIG